MTRTTLFRLALAGVMIVGAGVASARAGSPKQPLDLSGQWRLDPSKSDMPGRAFGGGWTRGPRMGGRGGQRLRLPDEIRIEQSEGFVTLEDSSGTAIREIATRGGSADSTSLPPDVPRLLGQWKGDRLEVKHEDARGGTITETFSLDDKGRSLVLKTKIEGRRTFEIKRVYRRVNAS
jgi:hypothetical protein